MSFVVHRVTKSAARYTDAGGREKCGYCRFFVPPRSCGKVIGPVSPQGWCKHFSRQMVSQFGGGSTPVGGGPPGMTFERDFLAGSLGTGAVFTRASTGTYTNSSGTLVSAAINTPRFDYDPQTLQLRGLLLEDAKTNLVVQSGNFANAAWSTFNAVVAAPVITANQTTAPDGTLTAAKIVYPAVTGAGAVSVVQQFFTYTAAPHAYSVYLKGNVGGEQVYLGHNVNGFLSSPRITLTTAWQRFSVTGTAVAGTSGPNVGTDLRDPAQTSTTAQTIFAWGAQVETNYMSSYIPTAAASATRAGDALLYPIASVTGFSATQGSLAHEYIVEGGVPGYNGPLGFAGANVNTDTIVPDGTWGGGSTPTTPYLLNASISVAGANVAVASYGANAGPILPGVAHKGSMSWMLNGVVNAAHDGLPATASGSIPSLPVIAYLVVAGAITFQPMISQWARRIRYWPRQLSQAELISVTT